MAATPPEWEKTRNGASAPRLAAKAPASLAACARLSAEVMGLMLATEAPRAGPNRTSVFPDAPWRQPSMDVAYDSCIRRAPSASRRVCWPVTDTNASMSIIVVSATRVRACEGRSLRFRVWPTRSNGVGVGGGGGGAGEEGVFVGPEEWVMGAIEARARGHGLHGWKNAPGPSPG